MLAQRNVKFDLFALALLALVVFLTMSLFTYDPADPPSSLSFPPRTAITNACGHSGAWAAYLMFNALGLAAYYAVFSLAAVDGVLLTRRTIQGLLLRTIGWLLSLLGVATLAAMALSAFSPGPTIGAGGYLGAAGRGWLEMHFASAGAYILVASAILGGLLLCTDYVLLRLAALLFGVPLVVTLRMVARRLPAPAISLAKKTAQETAAETNIKQAKTRRGTYPRSASPRRSRASVGGSHDTTTIRAGRRSAIPPATPVPNPVRGGFAMTTSGFAERAPSDPRNAVTSDGTVRYPETDASCAARRAQATASGSASHATTSLPAAARPIP